MKIRNGFVSNSSSSSFIISKEHITPAQISLIKAHLHNSRKINQERKSELRHPLDTRDSDEWQIHETAETLEGSTLMDNFDMHWYLCDIGVDMGNVEFNRGNALWHDWGDDGNYER